MRNRLTTFSWIVAMILIFSWRSAPAASNQFVRIAARGVQLPGGELYSDAGFDLLDWNGDGQLQLFLPNPAMTASSVHMNEGTKTQPKFGPSYWYPMNFTETEPQTVVFNQLQSVCDLNHDGLFDLILFDGQLRLVYNTGTKLGPNHWNLALPRPFFPGSPRMLQENTRATGAPESMYWGSGIFPRQVLTLTVVDWDGDGLEDLLICRFKDEAPKLPVNAQPPATNPPPATWDVRLPQAPARGLYFYKNVGTREKPWFDAGIEITTPDGKSIAAPNPVVADIDGDGIPDLVSTETDYACNSFRVDWPTTPSVIWFRRPSKADVAHLEPARPVLDAVRKPIPAGVQARFADFRGCGVNDLFVQDPFRGIRWYQNSAPTLAAKPSYAPPTVIQGDDFARFGFMYQLVVVNWFGPHSRDLILHGCYDAHCQKALRRTVLYRNVATKPGEIKYAFVGFCNFRGDPALVPQGPAFDRSGYDIYGSYVAPMPDDGSGKQRLVMSVSGKLYLFTNLAADGLTFQDRKPLNLPEPAVLRSCPVLVDWSRTGKLDLLLAVLNTAGKNWPIEKEYRLYRNHGTNADPKFDDYQLCADETGRPIVLPALGVSHSVAPQCGLAVVDMTGAGLLDLVVEEGLPRTGLALYQNLGGNPTNAPRFKFVKNLGDPVPIEYPGGYRYFYCGDVDGDGVPDLINNQVFFKGVRADAPVPVTNLTVTGVDRQGVDLRWTKPPGATQYDLRFCSERAMTEIEWGRGVAVVGQYTVADGALETARLPLSAGQVVRIAIKSANAKGEMAPLSDSVAAVLPPRQRLVLRNGPAGAWVTPAYNGTQACTVDATKPTQVVPKQPDKLEARTTAEANSASSPKQKLVLIRFTDLPRLARLERATLELSTDSQFERYPVSGTGGEVELSCSAIRNDWDAAQATFAEAAPGKAWAARELDADGTFLSKAPLVVEVRQHQTLVWDVTRAVQAALQAGQSVVSLLVRAEYTGKYCAGAGYNFCGPSWPLVEYRPRLCLVSRDAAP